MLLRASCRGTPIAVGSVPQDHYPPLNEPDSLQLSYLRRRKTRSPFVFRDNLSFAGPFYSLCWRKIKRSGSCAHAARASSLHVSYLRLMSRKYKFHNPEGVYFISFAVVYWLDVFIRNEYRDILLESWQYCMKEKGLNVNAWCIMTSHVHLIIESKIGKPEVTVGQMKKYTSQALRKAIKEHPQESRREWLLWMMERAGSKSSNSRGFQFWQHHNQPIELYTPKVIAQKLEYLHNNPVAAGFVDAPEDYLYSSARDYCGKLGLLEGLTLL